MYNSVLYNCPKTTLLYSIKPCFLFVKSEMAFSSNWCVTFVFLTVLRKCTYSIIPNSTLLIFEVKTNTFRLSLYVFPLFLPVSVLLFLLLPIPQSDLWTWLCTSSPQECPHPHCRRRGTEGKALTSLHWCSYGSLNLKVTWSKHPVFIALSMKVDILYNLCVTVGGNQCQVITMFNVVLSEIFKWHLL